MIGGAQYPQDVSWARNIHFVRHLPPGEHSAFFASSRATLNITHADMARMGWCPSGRLFEAAACETPILTDEWDGLGAFFAPERELLVVKNSQDVLAALERSDEELKRMASRARARVLTEHTSKRRALQLLTILENVRTTTSTNYVERLAAEA